MLLLVVRDKLLPRDLLIRPELVYQGAGHSGLDHDVYAIPTGKRIPLQKMLGGGAGAKNVDDQFAVCGCDRIYARPYGLPMPE